MRHQGGSAGEILGRKLARFDPQPWWGGSARWEPPTASRAPSFLAARHPPLCPRLRRGVLTARISFSGACSLGRLRRCMPMRSAAFLTGCTISTPPATRVRTPRALQVRHSRQPAPGNGRSPTALRRQEEVRGKIADVLKKTAFKLCRMLLPGGETKQIKPYHTTAESYFDLRPLQLQNRGLILYSCFTTQRSLRHASYLVQYALIPTTNLTRPACRVRVGMCPARTCDPAKTSSALHLHRPAQKPRVPVSSVKFKLCGG
jgi:hypothetical protein